VGFGRLHRQIGHTDERAPGAGLRNLARERQQQAGGVGKGVRRTGAKPSGGEEPGEGARDGDPIRCGRAALHLPDLGAQACDLRHLFRALDLCQCHTHTSMIEIMFDIKQLASNAISNG
jgi:hypothetical protein